MYKKKIDYLYAIVFSDALFIKCLIFSQENFVNVIS